MAKVQFQEAHRERKVLQKSFPNQVAIECCDNHGPSRVAFSEFELVVAPYMYVVATCVFVHNWLLV